MSFPFFPFVYIMLIAAVGTVLYRLRAEPLYEPRVLLSLAGSMWLLILHGYLINFDGYLAAKPGFYSKDIALLSAMALGLWLLGYLSFVGGATLGSRLKITAPKAYDDASILVPVCVVLILISIANFLANVVVVSGGNIVAYLSNFAVRSHELKGGVGFSASAYLLGFIGIQVITYNAALRGAPRWQYALVAAGVVAMLMLRFSQGRIFQTLVLLGVCFTAYALGRAQRNGKKVGWPKQVHLLVLMGFAGIGIYFLRLASALKYLGHTITLESVRTFGSSFVHFSLERGNVPNFPIVFTILDKMPSEQGFYLGSTLFNWALTFVPKSFLAPDYLISLRIKDIWYQDIEGGGLPPTAVGEWYANFGLAGVVVGMFVVGVILAVLYKRATISRSPYAAVLWANFAFGFVVIYPKTDLSQVPVFSMFIIIALWALMLILRSAARGRRE